MVRVVVDQGRVDSGQLDRTEVLRNSPAGADIHHLDWTKARPSHGLNTNSSLLLALLLPGPGQLDPLALHLQLLAGPVHHGLGRCRAEEGHHGAVVRVQLDVVDLTPCTQEMLKPWKRF